MSYSHTEENYLKAVYHLQLSSEVVSTNELARRLHTSAASVTDMMKKLHAKQLLHYKPYHGFSLSAEGKKAALYIIRRHRLWEFFLAEKLAFGWDEVHDIAEELEHVGNKKLIEKLDAYLGFPRFDPHGDPIPDSKGKLHQPELIPLNDLHLGIPVILHSVTQQNRELLEHLDAKNLRLGTQLEARNRSSFDGSVDIRLAGKTITLSEQLAAHLLVKKL